VAESSPLGLLGAYWVSISGLAYVYRLAELCIYIVGLDPYSQELIDFEPLAMTLFDPSCTNKLSTRILFTNQI
jgi:hypothetical protein